VRVQARAVRIRAGNDKDGGRLRSHAAGARSPLDVDLAVDLLVVDIQSGDLESGQCTRAYISV
jgi:hypothetical protein